MTVGKAEGRQVCSFVLVGEQIDISPECEIYLKNATILPFAPTTVLFKDFTAVYHTEFERLLL